LGPGFFFAAIAVQLDITVMNYVNQTLASLAENLALDEALLLAGESAEGGEVLHVWEWASAAVVLGAASRLTLDVDEAACQADGVPILRRSSGGGTVLLGKGCLVYSLILAYDRSPALGEIPTSYVYILERVRDALSDLLPGLELAGTSDLAAGGRKVSGNAQQRKRTHLLHHGTLLYDFDLAQVGRHLRMPERRPEYRGQRGHEDFLMNLPAGAEELKRRLRAAWGADTQIETWPESKVASLVQEKYLTAEWIRRR
jgi:lipoate-protein ligase A